MNEKKNFGVLKKVDDVFIMKLYMKNKVDVSCIFKNWIIFF